MNGAAFCVPYAMYVPLFFSQSQKGNESDLRSVDFYPGNGTFDLMYYPYYGKFTHVSKDLLCSLEKGRICREHRCAFWLFWVAMGRTEAMGTEITELYFCLQQIAGNPWGLPLPLASNGNDYIYHLETKAGFTSSQRRSQQQHFPRG